jgi:hypothetical protein
MAVEIRKMNGFSISQFLPEKTNWTLNVRQEEILLFKAGLPDGILSYQILDQILGGLGMENFGIFDCHFWCLLWPL